MSKDMNNNITENAKKQRRRALRVRQHLHGTGVKPRLCVVKSNKHIHAQLIDDDAGVTLAYVSTGAKELKNTEFGKRNKASARKLGENIAKIAQEKHIQEIIFDRGPFKYHGILAELADGARQHGLKF
jgi:large subunit ribosomal protein L18